MRNCILAYCICFVFGISFSQEVINPCITEVMNLEKELFKKDLGQEDKAAFIHYKIRTEDQLGEVVSSEVKMYKNINNMHFFSDQVNIYTDKTESFMVIKGQKLIMGSTTPPNSMKSVFSDDFLSFKAKFMKSCEVQSCIVIDSLQGIKEVSLVISKENKEVLSINSMIYRYSIKENKIISTTVNYSKPYKLKTMTINYIDFQPISTYTFSKARKYILESKGKLVENYKGYEFIDDREKK